MKARVTLVALVAVVLGAAFASSAAAKEVSIKGHSQSQVKKGCDGVFWPKNGPNDTYGCLGNDGGGIVCGGYNAHYKKTCTIMRPAPPGAYRRDVRAAVARQ
jgi:hypothetical protein